MKRSSFLKSLVGIAVAPLAIAKVMETGMETEIAPISEVPEELKGKHWFNYEEFKLQQEFYYKLEQDIFTRISI